MQKITPFLWFDDKAEEAVNFYVSIFSARGGNSKIKNITRYSEDVPGPKRKVMSIIFELAGQEFMALNGGPGVFSFSGAISFVVRCESQEEVDYYWAKLTEDGDGKAQRCGWLKDKYGIYWQIIPNVLGELLNDPDQEKAKRVTKAMLQMKKIDINGLRQAYEQG